MRDYLSRVLGKKRPAKRPPAPGREESRGERKASEQEWRRRPA